MDDVAVQVDYDGPGLDRIVFKRALRKPSSARTHHETRLETDLTALLGGLNPRRHAGTYVYTRVAAVPLGADPVVVVHEDEGTTLVVRREQADDLGFRYDFVAGSITQQIHSALDAVGLTAAVSEVPARDRDGSLYGTVTLRRVTVHGL